MLKYFNKSVKIFNAENFLTGIERAQDLHFMSAQI